MVASMELSLIDNRQSTESGAAEMKGVHKGVEITAASHCFEKTLPPLVLHTGEPIWIL